MKNFFTDVLSSAPGTLIDWGACMFFMWLVSLTPSWFVAAFVFGIGIVATFVKAAIQASLQPSE